MSELTAAALGDPAPLDEATALSAEWLTAALGVEVTGVEVVERNQGMATKVRILVDYADGAADIPRALCIKGYFGWPAEHLAGVKRETLFYRDLAADLDVRTPGCLHAGIDPATGHSLLVLEDLIAAGATFLSALAPFRVEQSAATLDQLARLHAAFWDRPADAVPDGLGPRTLFGGLDDPAFLQSQMDDGRADGVPASVRDGERLRRAMAAMSGSGVDAARCLIHGDTHVGNLYEMADGSIGVADWQVMHYAPWAIDVAYHVTTALDVEDRRRNERDLLAHYLDRLAAQGVAAPGWDEAWLAYRSCLPYGYFMWVITRLVHRPIIEVLTHRLGTAVADHDSFDLLDA